MKILSFILICFLSTSIVSAQDADKINWLTWEEAVEKSKIEKKKIFVDIYTDWCGWCKKMDIATFQKPHIVKYMNENYYAVKFNAERKTPIVYNGQTYEYKKQGRRGYHELAYKITKGQLSYPTIVFIDEHLNIIQPIPGFRDPMEFEMMMTYFGYDIHKTTPWATYQTEYEPMRKSKSMQPKANRIMRVKDNE